MLKTQRISIMLLAVNVAKVRKNLRKAKRATHNKHIMYNETSVMHLALSVKYFDRNFEIQIFLWSVDFHR